MSSPVHDALKTQIVELTLKSNLLVKEIKDLRKEHLDNRALVTNIYNLAKMLPDYIEEDYSNLPILEHIRTTKVEREIGALEEDDPLDPWKKFRFIVKKGTFEGVSMLQWTYRDFRSQATAASRYQGCPGRR